MITRSMSEIMLRRIGLQTVTALLSRAQSQKRVEEQSEERNQFRPDSTQLYIRGWLKSGVLNNHNVGTKPSGMLERQMVFQNPHGNQSVIPYAK